MKLLKDTFYESFNLHFDDYFRLPENLIPINSDHPNENYFYYTDLGKDDSIPYLVQGSIGAFLEEAPAGYFQIGFWGHGANSYGFYYCRTNEWSRVFFRLSFGGVYMDNDEEAEKIRKFLPTFFNFDEQIRGKVEYYVAVDSMGEGHYAIQKTGKPIFEIHESFYEDILHKNRFVELLNAVG